MLVAGVFNGGQQLLEVFGQNANGILGGRVAPETVLEAVYLVTVSFGLMHWGALIAFRRAPAAEDRWRSGASERRRAARLVGWTLLAVAIVPTLMFFKVSIAVVMDYGYLGLYRNGGQVSIVQVLSSFLIPGAVFLLTGSGAHKGARWVALGVVGAHAALCLFLGARGAAAMGCVAVAWAYDRSVRRIPRKLIAVLVMAALIVFALVRETRSTGGRWRLSLAEQYASLTTLQDPVTSSISEMGYSLVTVTHTLSLVPSSRDHDWAASYLYALAALLPNFGWEVHPTVAHGLLADWLVKTVDPTVAAAGGGLGFSFIAEAYLNFGWFGGPLWLGILGYLLCRLFLLADSVDPAKRALIASVLSFSLIFARGESAAVVRGLVWYALIPYLLTGLLARQVRRRRAAYEE
jgi:oligosaccharide repeat unit polymerase